MAQVTGYTHNTTIKFRHAQGLSLSPALFLSSSLLGTYRVSLLGVAILMSLL